MGPATGGSRQQEGSRIDPKMVFLIASRDGDFDADMQALIERAGGVVYVAGSEWEADRRWAEACAGDWCGTRCSVWLGSDLCPAGVSPAAGPDGRRT